MNGTMAQKLAMYMQMAFQYAPMQQKQQIYNDMAAMGMMPNAPKGPVNLTETDNVTGGETEEHAFVEKAREQSQTASQPDGGKVVADH